MPTFSRAAQIYRSHVHLPQLKFGISFYFAEFQFCRAILVSRVTVVHTTQPLHSVTDPRAWLIVLWNIKGCRWRARLATVALFYWVIFEMIFGFFPLLFNSCTVILSHRLFLCWHRHCCLLSAFWCYFLRCMRDRPTVGRWFWIIRRTRLCGPATNNVTSAGRTLGSILLVHSRVLSYCVHIFHYDTSCLRCHWVAFSRLSQSALFDVYLPLLWLFFAQHLNARFRLQSVSQCIESYPSFLNPFSKHAHCVVFTNAAIPYQIALLRLLL